jgi:hypothetical protein
MNLEDLREYLHMPPQKIHGRDVTLEGKMWFSEKLTTVDENGKKVSLKEVDVPQRRKVIKEFTDQKKEELDEKVASGDILEYQKKEWIVDKTGKISFWYLESFGMKIKDFLNRNEVSDWVGFDWDNQETVDKLITDSEKISNYFQNLTAIPTKYFDKKWEINRKWKPDPIEEEGETQPIGFKFIYTLTGSEDGHLKFFEESGASDYGTAKTTKLRQVGKTKKFAEGPILTQPVERRPKRITRNWAEKEPWEGPIRIEIDLSKSNIFTSDNLAKNWAKKFEKAIDIWLESDRWALRPHHVNTIVVTGSVTYHHEDSVTIRLQAATTTTAQLKTEDTAKLPKAAPSESKGDYSGSSFRITTQFKTYTYNPLRREFSNHVAARLRRLGEKIGVA